MNILQSLFSPFMPPMIKLILKANQLAVEGKHEAAIRIFEEKMGISRTDREDLPLLHNKTGRWLAQNGRDDQTLMFVAQYASSFGLIRAFAPSLTVLEAALGLESNDYKDSKSLAAKLDGFWFGLDDGTRFMLWMGLHGVLSIIGRGSEAMDVFRYDLGILDITTGDEYRQEVKNRIENKLGNMNKDITAVYLTFIFPIFGEMKLQQEGLALFEDLLGLIPDDYERTPLLAQKVNKWIGSLQNPLSGEGALLGLAGSLYQANEVPKALALLEAYPGIQVSDYTNVERLSRKWKTLCNKLPTDTAATYYRLLLSMLETVRRNPEWEVKALVQADSDLRDADFESLERVGQKLRQRMALFQEDTKGAYIFSLCETMDRVGMHREAAMVLEWFMDQHASFWNVPVDGDPAIVHVIAILSHWFRFFYQDPNEKVLLFCRQTMVYLRRGLGSQGIRLEDRKDFIYYIGLLKTAVLNTGFFRLGLQPSAEAEAALALEVLLWDVELAQRTLAERFVLENRYLLPADPSVKPNQWPFVEPAPNQHTDLSALLAGRQAVPASLSDEATGPFTIEPLSTHDADTEATRTADPLAKALRQTVDEPMWADTIAQAVGTDALILRLTFQDDGCLTWMAFLSDGTQLTFAGRHTGTESDLASVTKWVGEHGAGIKDYWVNIKNRKHLGPDFLTALTQTYLECLSGLLRLDALAPLLHDQLQIIVQADGLLNAVPFPYLNIQEKPLFLQTASVHQSISLLLQTLQRNAQSSAPKKVSNAQKIGVASWFAPTEGSYAREAARQLHAAHLALAQEHGLACFALADEPPCSAESLAGLVQQQQDMALLTILGHGHWKYPGICLKNEHLWYGNGCDLSGVDLVLMVSCSIGRLQADRNNLDVEGFCIQLAVNRAFSVIACRWQIDAWEACLFANEIAKQYLALSQMHPKEGHLSGFAKARALNAARKVFYRETGNQALNTLAAFEFYGLG